MLRARNLDGDGPMIVSSPYDPRRILWAVLPALALLTVWGSISEPVLGAGGSTVPEDVRAYQDALRAVLITGLGMTAGGLTAGTLLGGVLRARGGAYRPPSSPSRLPNLAVILVSTVSTATLAAAWPVGTYDVEQGSFVVIPASAGSLFVAAVTVAAVTWLIATCLVGLLAVSVSAPPTDRTS